jgi:hypothetical protein
MKLQWHLIVVADSRRSTSRAYILLPGIGKLECSVYTWDLKTYSWSVYLTGEGVRSGHIAKGDRATSREAAKRVVQAAVGSLTKLEQSQASEFLPNTFRAVKRKIVR